MSPVPGVVLSLECQLKEASGDTRITYFLKAHMRLGLCVEREVLVAAQQNYEL